MIIKKLIPFTAILLSGCAAVPSVPSAVPKELPKIEEKLPETKETVNSFSGSHPITYLPISPDVMVPLPIRSDIGSLPLRNTRKEGWSSYRGIEAALTDLLNNTGYGIVFIGERPTSTVSISNMSGSIPDLIRASCRSAAVHCVVRDNVVEISKTARYIVKLPRTEKEDGSKIAEAIQSILGDKGTVKADDAGGTLMFDANVEGAEEVSRYLNQIRANRSTIDIQMWISEVALSKQSDTGINWKSLSGTIGDFALSAAGGSTISAPTTEIGVVLDGSKFSMESVIKFIGKQGSTFNIQTPRMTIESGKETEFSNVEKFKYVSGVGQNNSVIDNNEDTNGTGTGTGTGTGNTNNSSNLTTNVQTEEIEVGTTWKVWADYNMGKVSTEIDIKLSELIGFQTVASAGTELSLPRTAEREVKGKPSIRPGDIAIIAGTQAARTAKSLLGLPGFSGVSVPLDNTDTTERRELVVMLRPTIIKYVPVDENGVPISDTHTLIDGQIVEHKGPKPIPSDINFSNYAKPVYAAPYREQIDTAPQKPNIVDVPATLGNGNTEAVVQPMATITPTVVPDKKVTKPKVATPKAEVKTDAKPQAAKPVGTPNRLAEPLPTSDIFGSQPLDLTTIPNNTSKKD